MDREDIEELYKAIRAVGDAISPSSAVPGTDAASGSVDSLTEAVMGVTAGLMAVASAIESLADAVRERHNGAE